MTHTLSRMRSGVLAAFDLLIVLLSFVLAAAICRLEMFTIESLYSALLLVIIYSVMLSAFRGYKSLWRYAQPTEFLVCFLSTFSGGFLFFLGDRQLIHTESPRDFYYYTLIACFSAIGVVGMRVLYRALRSKTKASQRSVGKRTLLVGAGAAALSLIVFSKESRRVEYLPVAAVDDDPTKLGKNLYGVRVCGTTDDIARVCKKYAIDAIVIAIPTASNKRRAEIIEKCMDTDCIVKTLPAVSLIAGASRSQLAEHIREIMPEELLGREPVETASEKICDVVFGKTVLVTGGGGSIGSELCRQIAAHSPKRLIVVDIYENNAYDIEQELKLVYGGSLDLLVLIASVRDFDRINDIFKTYRPEIVFHAAAHKHVPLMEISPKEAVKNNIFGTKNTALAAMQNHVERFILISTDKAVNPTNIMGATKRVCEMMIQSFNGRSDTVFLAVRFGNVLGSNGSVIPLFKKQIESGGPVNVTHPEIIRYFMTIPEAALLVLTAAALAKGGEIFVLDMGEPVKIDDLAKKMIKLAGLVLNKDIVIKYTGLRPGEKLYEELLTQEEGIRKTENNKIFIGKQGKFDWDVLSGQLETLERAAFREDTPDELLEQHLRGIVSTFRRSPEQENEMLGSAVPQQGNG